MRGVLITVLCVERDRWTLEGVDGGAEAAEQHIFQRVLLRAVSAAEYSHRPETTTLFTAPTTSPSSVKNRRPFQNIRLFLIPSELLQLVASMHS